MSKSVQKITIDHEGNTSFFPLSVDAYDTFDDLRLYVAEDCDISFIGHLWSNYVIEHSHLHKIVVAFDDNVHIYQLV